MEGNALIIFQKNKDLGKVKTRLAATVGPENAMRVYSELVRHTHQVALQVQAKRFLYFSDEVREEEAFTTAELRIQKKTDLGERMLRAIQEVMREGFERVVVIGTDCYQLSPTRIDEAFNRLRFSDYVLGPALDGGYYLIGCSETHDSVFLNKEWSTETVFIEAVQSILENKATVSTLVPLSDVDTDKDLGTLSAFIQ